jgi:hypothetical protein
MMGPKLDGVYQTCFPTVRPIPFFFPVLSARCQQAQRKSQVKYGKTTKWKDPGP